MPDELPGAKDPFGYSKLSFGETRKELNEVTEEINSMAQASARTQQEWTRLRELTERYEALLRRLGDTFKEATDRTGSLTEAFKQLGSGVIGLADSSKLAVGFLSTAASSLQMLGGKAGAAGEVIGLLAKGVDVYDRIVVAQRTLIQSQTQLGVSYSEHMKQIEATSAALTQAGARWGMTRDEIAKIMQPMTAGGLGARAGDTEEMRAERLGRDLPAALDAALQAYRAQWYGLDQANKAVTQFGTLFDLEGREFSRTLATVAEMGGKSAMGMAKHLETVMQLNEQTKVYGGNLAGVLLYTTAFSDELKKGTLTMENMTRLVSPAAMQTGQQAAIVQILQQMRPQLARDLGISGLPVTEGIQKLQDMGQAMTEKMREGKFGAADLGSLGAIREAILAAMPQARESPFIAKEALGAFNINVPTQTAAFKLLTAPLEVAGQDLAKTIRQQEDASRKMERAADKMFDKFKTSGEAFADYGKGFGDLVLKAGQEFRNIITGVKDTVKTPGAFSGAVAASVNILKAGLDVAADPYSSDPGRWSHRGKSFGDMVAAKAEESALGSYELGTDVVPMTGSYRLHAGERVSRQGESSGGLTLNMGGITVSVAEGGSLRAQIAEAFERAKDEAVREVERRFEMSRYAK